MSSKFYWLKLRKDYLKRHDIKILESMPDGQLSVLFYLKLMLESVDHEGELRFSDKVPYTPEMLATVTDTDADVAKASIKRLQDLGMIEIESDGTIIIDQVKSMIGCASDSDSANRQRRYRERKKEECDILLHENVTPVTDSVTNCDADRNKTSRDIEIEIEKEIDIDIDKQICILPPVISETENRKALFAQFWEAYPKCKRKVDRAGCEKKFIKIPDLENIFPTIMASLESWKQEWSKKNYEYVPMPAKWIHQQYWTVTDMRTEREQIVDDTVRSSMAEFIGGGGE